MVDVGPEVFDCMRTLTRILLFIVHHRRASTLAYARHSHSLRYTPTHTSVIVR